MPFTKLNPTLNKIFTLALIGYIFVILGQGVYRNYTINTKIEALKSEIENLQEENQTLAMKIEFYRTDTFKDLEARRRLNMKRPDEQMVVLPKDEGTTPKADIAQKPKLAERPNYQLWLDYFKN